MQSYDQTVKCSLAHG